MAKNNGFVGNLNEYCELKVIKKNTIKNKIKQYCDGETILVDKLYKYENLSNDILDIEEKTNSMGLSKLYEKTKLKSSYTIRDEKLFLSKKFVMLL